MNVDETLYTRVTKVLEPFSDIREMKKDPERKEILDNAGSRGTVVHKLCDWISKGIDIDGYKDLLKEYCRNTEHMEKEEVLVLEFVKSFQGWAKDKKFIKTPQRFFCDTYMITGECDLIYEDERGLILVDLKTPASESPTWLLQGSAYSYLAKLAGYNIAGIEFVKLSRTGGKAKVFRYEENFELFRAALLTYRHFYADQKQENYLDYI